MMSLPVGDKLDEQLAEDWMDNVQCPPVTRAQMNNLIMDYLVTEGFKEAAEKFQNESGTVPKVALESMNERIMIREAVQMGDIQGAISLVNDQYPELLDNNRYLYFHLQQQYLIELIRNKDVAGALDFAQNHLAERADENPMVLNELERTLALLAFENPEQSKFGDLMQPTHRHKVASELNTAILEAQEHKSVPALSNLMRLVIWAQDQLDKKKVKYPRIHDLSQGYFASEPLDPSAVPGGGGDSC